MVWVSGLAKFGLGHLLIIPEGRGPKLFKYAKLDFLSETNRIGSSPRYNEKLKF